MLTIVLALSLIGHQNTAADQKLTGATDLIKRLSVAAPNGDNGSKAAELRSRLKKFADASDGLDAPTAAHEWLVLLNACLTAPNGGDRVSVSECLAVLPGPSAWPGISHEIKSDGNLKGAATLPQSAKLLLAHVLDNDFAGQRKDVAKLHGLAQASPGSGGGMSDPGLEYQLALRSRQPEWIVAAYRAGVLQDNFDVPIPNYINLVGVARAKQELAWLLSHAKASLSPPASRPDRALVAEVLAQSISTMKSPQWSLVADPGEAVKLVPSMEKRFPGGKGEDPQRSVRMAAKALYCVGLVRAARLNEAMTIAGQFSWSDVYDFDQLRKYGKELLEIDTHLAASHPDLVNWNEFGMLVANSGHPEVALHVYAEVLKSPKMKGPTRIDVLNAYALALLGSDHVDEGIATLRKSIAEQVAQPKDAYGNGRYSMSQSGSSAQWLMLARLGKELGRQDLLEEGIAGLKKVGAGSSYSFAMEDDAVGFLVGLGRLADAQEVAVAGTDRGPRSMVSTGTLFQLCSIFYAAHRPQDVLDLVDKYPNWNADDLSAIYLEGYSPMQKVTGPCLGFYVAWALAETGKTDQAYQVLLPCLYQDGAFDPAYELLLKLKGNDSIPLLDALYRHDAFEERPLMWKGVVLQQQGKLDEAAAALRQAISVDPSDGNEPHGYRLRAYAILGDVLAAQGHNDEAANFKSAVRAIRTAEKADDLVLAGLFSRAAKQYDAALNIFVDAYCIQSRLAVRLAGEGNVKEAAEHFKKAYELMPSSFGRVETHCFGCEGVFETQAAQNIAEDVLAGMAQKTPGNPKIHYLLGYLHEDEGRTQDAIAEYRQATLLDRDYLNAWVHLASLATEEGTDPQLVQAANLALVRLDPNGLHTGPTMYSEQLLPEVIDLAALWKTAKLSQPDTYSMPDSVYPLTASAITLRQTDPSGLRNRMYRNRGFEFGMNGISGAGSETPSQRVASSKVMTAIARLMDAGVFMGDSPFSG